MIKTIIRQQYAYILHHPVEAPMDQKPHSLRAAVSALRPCRLFRDGQEQGRQSRSHRRLPV